MTDLTTGQMISSEQSLVIDQGNALQLSAEQKSILEEFLSIQERSLSANTLRGLRTDIGNFLSFCRANNLTALPASLSTIRAYMRYRADQGVKATTISRALSSISKLHDAIRVTNECRSELVRSEMKAIRKMKPQRQKQAPGIPFNALWEWDQAIAKSDDLKDIRDRALMWVFYDGLLRGDEIYRAECSWLEIDGDDGILNIPTHKTDQDGQGSEVYLSAHTVEVLNRWLDAAEIQSGRIFRSFTVSGQLRDSIHTNGIRAIIGKRGYEMGVLGATNHSLRVGATQDLIAAGVSSAQIQLAGRWKHERMVMQYGRKHRVKTGAMAEMAKRQGRSK